ncbi:PREDICTED: uncharacterized protein LOC108362271 isoform X2 [Rhagoletis zephyria]|uniref:uncharacterized protein LOC108362271 isoform X2 n=1 Tax=Rhagoletis zephyria TaxID=28612 RepID=UPI0008117007|nr:PREDICTED: uncharacterized protein LOC108362271 isoform X2 [Rhagoletis zephyria]
MAGVPPIVPLLCSTPPPIDFGEEDDDSGLPPTLTLEDDDEYGDFAFAADINENATNTDIPSLPRTPLQFELSSSTTSGFTDVPPSLEECGNAPITPPPLQTEHDVCSAREEVKLELIEAINYNVVSRETNQERISDGITNVDETSNTNDSVTSHPQPEKDNNWVIHNLSDTKITNETCAESESLPKFAHTTDAITTKEKSGTKNVSILSNEQDINAQPNAITIFSEIPPPLTQLVLLEDIADDSSDEECHRSPKKSTISTTSPFTSSADINSADFFAIHVVGAPSSPKEDKPLTKVEDINMNSLSNHDNNITHEFENITKTTPYGGEELNDDFGDFADFESATEITIPTTCPMKTADSNVITKSECNDVKPVDELPVESTIQNNDDENDFDDFQDFCSAPTSVSNTKPIISSQNSEGVAATCNDGIKKGIALNENSLATLKIDSESQAKEVENSDDDDFGDFEEASLAIPTSEFTANTAIMNTHTPPATSGNISDRIGSVLKLMFPPADESVDSDKERTAPDALSSLQLPNGTLPFESIEAAKALEFQWPQSEIRHALVRSIGIDSRNILFGENWNPSMPRFAANLSFNPLKPLKPQTVNPSTTTAGIDSEHYSNGSDVSNYSMKTDVPDVEFDWQSAGLVNPLDDKVMVMATKLDNLTVDSSFSACATTLEQITSTTTPKKTTTTTADYKLTNEINRFQLMPLNTQIIQTTTTTTPALVTSGQLSSSISSLPPTLLTYNNKNVFANSTSASYSTPHNTNTFPNPCTYQNCQTNARANCNTTHVNRGLCASHSTNTFASLHSLVAQRRTVGNVVTIEPLMYFKNFTNHISATLHQNPTLNMINNNTIHSNLTTHFEMPTFKTDQLSNCIYAPTLKCDDFCNDNNLTNNPLEFANFHLKTNRMPDCSWVKGETNTRETETVHSSPPVARLDTPDDQHQSHTTFTNVDDNISEALSNNDTKLTLTPTKDICPAPLTLDQPTYQLTAQDQSITISTNCISGSNTSNSRSYESRKTLSTLRLGANIVDNIEDDETVVTSTYAGPLKETHIYTPSKTEMATTVKTCKSPTNGNEPIDFDYEIAAAGIIIDEKVVKKEYRDAEYNPGFSLEMVNEYAGESPTGVPAPLESELSVPVLALTQPEPQHQQQPNPSVELDTDEFADFTEFQSVPPPTQATVTVATASYGGVTSNPTSTIASAFQKESNGKATNINAPPAFAAAISKAKEAGKIPSRTSSPSIIDNMILSPAILLPQAIPMNANNTVAGKATPSIEWGDTTANINPDELARIEELFPQPKITAAKDANTSQKSSPTHSYADNHAKNASISISAAVAMKEQDSTLSDDYWSEFVSVPVTPQLPNNAARLNNNNNNNYKLTPNRAVGGHVINSVTNSNNAVRSPRHQQQHVSVQRTLTPTALRKPILHTARGSVAINSNICNSNSYINSNSNTNTNSNDDDWSDFVSSTPALAAAPTHSTHYMPTAHAPQFNSAAWQNANFYNNPLGLYHQQLSNMQTRAAPLTPQQQQLQLQQQIHIMQDFSTAPVTARPNVTLNNSNNAHINSMQHSNSYSPMQVGNARVAPSISLIPDLGFVAPAMPVHTAFINVLPKTSFNSKK